MAITVAQAAPTAEALSLTTATATFGSPTTAGNTLVAVITTNGNTTNPVVSGLTIGGVADHWQAAVTGAGAPLGRAIWYDPNCVGGQTSVVVTCTGGAGTSPAIYVTVYEISGVLAFDQGSGGSSSPSVTNWSSGTTAAAAQPAEIFTGVAMGSPLGIPTVTGVGSWTTQGASATNFGQVAGYQIVSAGGTATFSGTQASGSYVALVATFYQVSSAAPAVWYPPVYQPGFMPGFPAEPFAAWPQYVQGFLPAQDSADAATTVTATGAASLDVSKAPWVLPPQYAPGWFPAAPSVPGGEPFAAWPLWLGATAQSKPLTAAATVTATGAAAVTESKPLTAATTVTGSAAAALTEAKPLTAAATVTATGAAAVTESKPLTAAATVAATGAATLATVAAAVPTFAAVPQCTPAWFPGAPAAPAADAFAPWPPWTGLLPLPSVTAPAATIGALTASDAPAGVLTGATGPAAATGAYAASYTDSYGTPGGVLAAATSSTGGPS